MTTVTTNKGTALTLTGFQRHFVLTRFGYFPVKHKYFKMIDCGTEFHSPGFKLHYKKDRDTGEITVGFEERGGGVATEYYNKQTFEI